MKKVSKKAQEKLRKMAEYHRELEESCKRLKDNFEKEHGFTRDEFYSFSRRVDTGEIKIKITNS